MIHVPHLIQDNIGRWRTGLVAISSNEDPTRDLFALDGPETQAADNVVAGGNAENIGFAIPINDVRGLIEQVVETGKFARPYVGIRYVSLSPEVAETYDLKVKQGAFVVPSADQQSSSVLPGGPADKAGLRERDVITAVNDKKIDQSHSLPSLLGSHRPGDKVTLTVQRGDRTLDVTVALGELPSDN